MRPVRCAHGSMGQSGAWGTAAVMELYLGILQSFPSRKLISSLYHECILHEQIRRSPCFSCVIARNFVTCPHIHNDSIALKSHRGVLHVTKGDTNIAHRWNHFLQKLLILLTSTQINKYTGKGQRIHDHLKHSSFKVRSTEIVEKVHDHNAGLSTPMHNNTTNLHAVGTKPQLQPHSKFVSEYVSRYMQ